MPGDSLPGYKVIRVGNPARVHKEVASITLDNLVANSKKNSAANDGGNMAMEGEGRVGVSMGMCVCQMFVQEQ